MRSLDSRNPISIFIYFAFAVIMTVFCPNPIVSLISLAGAVSLRLFYGISKSKGSFVFIIITALLCCLINPVFSHNGSTILLFVDNNPVTLEALLYGAEMGIMLAASIIWCISFTEVMTSDKVVYTVGSFSPKAALVLTLSLRFVPLFIRKAKEINDSQKVMGLYKDETIPQRVKGTARVLSAMLTYIIENTIITANSMASRGFGSGKRSRYALFKFTAFDLIFLMISIIFGAVCIISAAMGKFSFEFYPRIEMAKSDVLSYIGYICFAFYCALPILSEGGERLRWHFLKSKI